jgi:vacuolar-type H+-ATPase subunit H
MAKTQVNTQSKNDEFAKIFDEYRAKIDEITKKTTAQTIQPTEEEPDNVVDGEAEKQEEVIAVNQQELMNIRAEVQRQAQKEALGIINEAKQKAQQLIDEVEENINKEAKKRTQSQVDKIINKAKKESEEIIDRARKAAEKQRGEIITTSKQETEHLIRDITEKCREETHVQSSQVIKEARKQAEDLILDVVNSSTEITKLITEITNKAKNTIQEFEGRLQTEFNELSTAITEAQKKLENINTVAFESVATEVEPSNGEEEIDTNTILAMKLHGEKIKGENGNGPAFKGQVELKSVTSFEYRHLKSLINYLVHVPNIKFVQEIASEKEMSVLFDVKEPLPLLEILGNSPLVDEVIAESDNISIILKNDGNE